MLAWETARLAGVALSSLIMSVAFSRDAHAQEEVVPAPARAESTSTTTPSATPAAPKPSGIPKVGDEKPEIAKYLRELEAEIDTLRARYRNVEPHGSVEEMTVLRERIVGVELHLERE